MKCEVEGHTFDFLLVESSMQGFKYQLTVTATDPEGKEWHSAVLMRERSLYGLSKAFLKLSDSLFGYYRKHKSLSDRQFDAFKDQNDASIDGMLQRIKGDNA